MASPRVSPTCVKACVKSFLDHVQTLVDAGKRKPATWDYYHWQFQHLLDAKLGLLELAAVRASHLLWAPHTNAFVRCVKKLVKHFKLPPIDDLPTPREGQRERTLDSGERERFWASCVGQEEAITRTIYATGLRPKEARELTVGQIRAERRIIELREFKSMDQRKDGLRRRGVPLPADLGRVLPWLVASAKSKFGDRIFSNRRSRPWTCQALRLAVRAAAGRAGLDSDGGEQITAYSFRHSFASDFLRGGGNPIELARIMGHAQLDTTDRYCHLSDGDQVRAYDRVFGAKPANENVQQIVQCGECDLMRILGEHPKCTLCGSELFKLFSPGSGGGSERRWADREKKPTTPR